MPVLTAALVPVEPAPLRSIVVPTSHQGADRMSDVSPEPVVLRDLHEGVLIATLNRPERNNGWNLAMETAYFDLLDAAATDPEVRVIVVTGAGRSFCPGLDV